MVFEAVVSSQLNRFLGSYIENLNSSQLKLGLLGGDVVLRKLILKQSALDDLDLPVKTVAGHLDELVLKIPWTNLYSAPSHVSIRGLYLLAVPNDAVVYDEKKEQEAAREAKKRLLERIEMIKMQEAAKDELKATDDGDGFLTKLAAQILQNLHITIEDVHIRYEDEITNPRCPFAAGITIKKMALESTDSTWVSRVLSEPSRQFFKLASLESLSVYWSSNAGPLLRHASAKEQLHHFRYGIATSQRRPYENSYIVGPITSYAKLRINTRPELDGSNFTIPKIYVNLTMEEIAMGLTPHQYEDIVLLLHSIERMNRAAPYRKYRPNMKSFREHAREGWHFAYKCIVEENIRRRWKNWQWEHIRKHRQAIREYIEVYKSKLTAKKSDPKTEKMLNEFEDQFDVFNITLARRQAEVQVARILKDQRKKQEEESKRGWFSGWFGRQTAASDSSGSDAENEIVKSLQAEMTPEEKSKLYAAIGYEENAVPATYPKEFVENRFEFMLKKLMILLHDSQDEKQPVILLSTMSRVEAVIEQRPVAHALTVNIKVGDFFIDGSPLVDDSPRLIQPFDSGIEILNLEYETNPLDETCHQRIRLAAQPLVVIYDAKTLQQVATMFRSDHASNLSQLQAAARQKLDDLKKTSFAGLEYAIQRRTVVDVDINIKGSYLFLPMGGSFHSTCGKILCNTGNLVIRSLSSRKLGDDPTVRSLVRAGSSEDHILHEMIRHSYDKFSIELHDVQVLSLLPNEDWKLLMRQGHLFYILKPMSIKLVVEKCLILDDPRLPKLKVSGSLPFIHLEFIDSRLINMAAVLKSIPSLTETNSVPTTTDLTAQVKLDFSEMESRTLERLEILIGRSMTNEEGHLVQATDLLLEFNLEDVRMDLSVQQVDATVKPLVRFNMTELTVVCTTRTFDTGVDLTLKTMSLHYYDKLESAVTLITSRPLESISSDACLLTVQYLDVNKQSPEFRTRYKSVRSTLLVGISSLSVDFQQEALIDIIQQTSRIGGQIETISAPHQDVAAPSNVPTQPATVSSSAKALLKIATPEAKKRINTSASEDVDFCLDAHFDRLNVNLGTREQRLAEITVSGLKVDSAIQKSQMVFRTGIDGFRVANPKSGTRYKQIAAVEDTEALRVDVTIFKHATENEGYVDMDVVDMAVRLSAGRLKAVYISSFVQDLLSFVDHFQAAKTAVIEASSAAAQAARENVQRVYVQATRLKLDVQIKAPFIIVPQTSKASDALIIDLGQLAVNNQFELRSVRNEIGSPAIMDSIALQLKDLRLYLAVVDGMVVESERSLIDPLTFNLTVARNLTATWYKEEPELSVDATLGKVDILLSEETYGKILKILIGNVQESQQTQRPAPQVVSAIGEISSKESEQVSTPSSDMSAEAILQRYGPTRVTLSFSVTLAEIKMQLLATEKIGKASGNGSVPASEKPLANLALEGLTASGKLMSDDTLQCTVVLRSCLLEDSRPFLLSPTSPVSPDASQRMIKRPIHRLLYPSTDNSGLHSCSEMLTADFNRDKNRDASARVHLCGFTLIVCPNYLLRLIHFFVCAPSDDLSHQPVNKPVVAKPVAAQHVSTAVKKLEEKAPLMTVSVVIDKPDIILIEHIDSLDTNALVLNMEIETTVLQLPQALDVAGSVSKLHIFSCVFDPARRRETMAEVLSPCSVVIRAKVLDDGEDSQTQIDVSISDVALSVSPGTCEMLANISKSIVTDGVVSVSEEQPVIKVWPNLWNVEPLSGQSLPFLEVEVAQEAFELNQIDEDDSGDTTRMKREQMILVLSHFTMILETGTGNRTSPLVLVESEVSLEVNNWTAMLEAKALLNLQAAYYNSLLALWEPLLEPVDTTRNGTSRQRPWEMEVTAKVRKQETESGCSSVTEIALESSDTMELTVSRTFLDVVSMLSEAFSQALKQQLSKKDVPAAHYMVRNDLDTVVVLDLGKSPFVLQDREHRSLTEVKLEPGAEIGLQVSASSRTHSVLQEQESENERLLIARIPDMHKDCYQIPVSRSSRRYLPASQRSDKGEVMGIVADICNDFGFRSISFRGVVQIRNHFRQAVDVYYMTKRGNELAGVGRVDEGQTLNVPPHALYTPTGELFFIPLGFGVSIVPFVWRDLQRHSTCSKVLRCSPRQSPEGDPFYMQVTGNVDHIYLADTRKKTVHSTCFEIHLRPTAILHNLLPVPLYVLACGTVTEDIVLPGQSRHLTSVELGTFIVLKIKDYLDRDWVCKEEVRPEPPELSVWSLESNDGTTKAVLDLGVYSNIKEHTLHLSVYCPFWMINNTGLMLTYKADDDHFLYHPETLETPILFSFRPKSFFGHQKKALVRVEDSDWSDRFSLDAAGSSGTVSCKSPNDDMTYDLGVNVQLSHEGLTKLVVFTPYFIISNSAPFDIQVRELGPASSGTAANDRWMDVHAGESLPFWPKWAQKWIVFRVASAAGQETLPLSFDNPSPTLLRLDNEFGGLFIDFQVSESSVIIVCHPYEEGRAPVLLVNHSSDCVVNIRESNDSPGDRLQLGPQRACYYTWRHPNGSRSLSWSYNDGQEDSRNTFMSSSGVFESSASIGREDEISADSGLQWISFLHGRQRVLLFTDDVMLIIQLQSAATMEPIEQRFSVSLHGLGISLVDSIRRREILYAAIASSGVIWETAKPSKGLLRFRPMCIRDNELLEEVYQQYSMNVVANPSISSRRELDGGRLLVDFKEGKTFKPKERHLRRSYRSGLELLFESSTHRRHIHARLNRLQMDNQLDDCVFPIVFAPVPPPRSLANESIPHPFIEASIVELLGQKSDVQQFHYFKLLVQECHIRIDMSLVNALGVLFAPDSELKSEAELQKTVEEDVDVARQDLRQRTVVLYGKVQENYFGNLHLSPLKIHLSFSYTGTGGASAGSNGGLRQDNPVSQLLSLIIQSVGVSLTEVQDVVFRLGYFERSNSFLSWQQLAREMQWHYVGQAVKQFYVLVFGLDVIGNPIGLALNITRGVEQLFYEPYQGIIQGPDEFVEGLTLGVRSLFGHTVAGMAGAASKITGTLGKGLAYLTFDEEYQKKRRETMLRRPNDLRGNLAQGGKGLFMGVVEGISGVVLRPIEGAKQQGVGGFFSGAVKGVVGLVTRPTSAVADFASGSLDAMKKVADVNEDLSRLRPPRFLHPDGVVRPYQRYQAEGDSLLKALDKGRFATTDYYVDHAATSGDNKSVLLVTDRRLLFVSRHDLFGQWQVEWGHTWEELTEPLQANPKGLYVPLRAPKKVLGLFTSGESGKLVLIDSQEKCEVIRKKVEKLMSSS